MILRVAALTAVLAVVSAAPASAQSVTTGSVSHNWSVARGKTKVLELTARKFNRSGVRVRVVCNGKGCPFKARNVAVKGGQAKSEKLFRGKRLRPGLTVSVLFAAPGTIGRFVAFTTRRAAIPSVKSACGTFDTTIPTGCVGPAGPQGTSGAPGSPGAQGPAGARGLPGSPGPSGVSTVTMRTGAPFVVNRNGFNTGVADCAADERATGGGVYPNSNVYFPSVIASFPMPNPTAFTAPQDGVTPTGWRVWVANNDVAGNTAPATVTMTPYVICVG